MLDLHRIVPKAGRPATAFLTPIGVLGPDGVSPHDADAIRRLGESWDLQDQLPSLVRGASQSRHLADEHQYSARQFVRQARAALAQGDWPLYRSHLENAREARRKAWECYRFARQCERRADAIAVSSGFRSGAHH